MNRHYGNLLAEAGLSSTRVGAETTRRAHCKELMDLVANKEKMLREVEDCVEVLERMNFARGCNSAKESPASELDGEWWFLYMETGRIFGFMRLEATESDGLVGSFGLPRIVLAEANSSLKKGGSNQRPTRGFRREAKCPACSEFFPLHDFWLHAVEEVCCRNIRVPAHRIHELDRPHRWVVPGDSGWTVPIYAVQHLDRTQELTESLRLLNVDNKLETHQLFCDNLDQVCQWLSKIIVITGCN